MKPGTKKIVQKAGTAALTTGLAAAAGYAAAKGMHFPENPDLSLVGQNDVVGLVTLGEGIRSGLGVKKTVKAVRAETKRTKTNAAIRSALYGVTGEARFAPKQPSLNPNLNPRMKWPRQK